MVFLNSLIDKLPLAVGKYFQEILKVIIKKQYIPKKAMIPMMIKMVTHLDD